MDNARSRCASLKSSSLRALAGLSWMTAGLFVIGTAAQGAEWKVRPELSVTERFSDNVALSEKESSGFVTSISPGLRLIREGGKASLDLGYGVDLRLYHSEDRSSSASNRLRANLKAELLEPWFYLDASAHVQQAASSLLGVFGADQTTAGDFSDVATINVAPSVRFRRGNLWLGEASLASSIISAGGSTSDSQSNELRARATSGSAFGRIGWSAEYVGDVTKYSDADAELRSQRLDLGASYRVAPKVRLLANAGYERLEGDALSEEQSGPSWSVGAQWQPTNRSVFQVQAGRRFFGDTYGLNLSHRTRRATWSLSYSEAVSSTRSQLDLAGDVRRQLDAFLIAGGVTDPIERASRIDALVDAIADQSIIISNQIFLQKRLQGSVVWDLPKHTFILSGFSSSRNVDAVNSRRSIIFGSSDFNVSRLIKDSGASATWNWLFMPKTSAVSTVSTALTEFTDIDREDSQLLLSFGLLHRLSRYASGSLEFRHQQRDSGGGQDFDENSIEAGLRLTY